LDFLAPSEVAECTSKPAAKKGSLPLPKLLSAAGVVCALIAVARVDGNKGGYDVAQTGEKS
jgi:hypothetical protein